jgi:hypothetical protein
MAVGVGKLMVGVLLHLMVVLDVDTEVRVVRPVLNRVLVPMLVRVVCVRHRPPMPHCEPAGQPSQA